MIDMVMGHAVAVLHVIPILTFHTEIGVGLVFLAISDPARNAHHIIDITNGIVTNRTLTDV